MNDLQWPLTNRGIIKAMPHFYDDMVKEYGQPGAPRATKSKKQRQRMDQLIATSK